MTYELATIYSPSRGERTAKYNRLLRIEEELGDAGHEAYAMHGRA